MFSFKNQFFTIKKNLGLLQLSIPIEQDFLIAVKNNVQRTNEQMKQRGVHGQAAESAGKYLVYAKGPGRKLISGEREKEKKNAVSIRHLVPWQNTQANHAEFSTY